MGRAMVGSVGDPPAMDGVVKFYSANTRKIAQTFSCKSIKIRLNFFVMKKKVFYIAGQKRLWVLYQFPKPVKPPSKTAA